MSIHREEAIDSLISCLRNSEFPSAQLAAAETIATLQGRFTASGKSLTRALLLKRAGHNKTYRNLMQMEKLGNFMGEFEENSVSFKTKALCSMCINYIILINRTQVFFFH